MSAAASIWSPSVLWSFFTFKWQNSLTKLYRHVYCQHDFIVIMRLMKIHLQVFPIEKSKKHSNHKCWAAWDFFPSHSLGLVLCYGPIMIPNLPTQRSSVVNPKCPEMIECTMKWLWMFVLFFFVCLFWLDSFLQSGCERLLLCCGSLQGHREHEAEHGIIQTLTSLSFKNSKTLLWCSLLWTVMLPLQMLGSWLSSQSESSLEAIETNIWIWCLRTHTSVNSWRRKLC